MNPKLIYVEKQFPHLVLKNNNNLFKFGQKLELIGVKLIFQKILLNRQELFFQVLLFQYINSFLGMV